jgi:hypothetical protein
MKPRRRARLLAAGASTLALWLLASPAAAEAIGDYLVTAGASWKYLANGSSPAIAWRGLGFDDGAWAQGPAQLGYGDGDEATLIPCGPSAPTCTSANFITSYFRAAFTVNVLASIPQLQLALLRDDGAVVYLNGVEVARSNLPAGAIGAATLASTAVSGSGETSFLDFPLPPDVLVAGANVLAVEVHQSAATSSDVSFDASLRVTAATPLALARAPYLQMATPTGVVVRWRTSAPSTTRARWGLAPGALTNTIDVPGIRSEHEVALGGLSPATRIYYAAGTSTQTLAGDDAEHAFLTPPPVGVRLPTRIWVIGDSGACATSALGCTSANGVRDGYLAFAGSQPADLWLMLGDNAYNTGTDAEFTAGFFNVYPSVMRSTPVWPVPGNHEFGASDSPTQSGPYYDSFTLPKAGEAGGVPSGSEAWYSFDWANVHFIGLDSHDSDRSAPASPATNVCPPGVGGAMYQWLCADLAATTQDFIIAFWHHPTYTKGSHDSDSPIDSEGRMQQMRERFLPVLDAYGVDLVLTGHSHSYERSLLLRDHYGVSSSYAPSQHAVDAGDGDPDGDGAYTKSVIGPSADSGGVYSVVGSSSQISGGTLDHPVMRVSLNVLGSLVIDVDGRQLDARFLGVAGNELDHFRIVKGPEIADQDQDGVEDAADDCLVLANLEQLDSDADGYGNRCDGDFDGSGGVGIADYGALLVAFGSTPLASNWNPDADMTGNGGVGLDDYGLLLAGFGRAPGPSGLACAGTPPCPAP